MKRVKYMKVAPNNDPDPSHYIIVKVLPSQGIRKTVGKHLSAVYDIEGAELTHYSGRIYHLNVIDMCFRITETTRDEYLKIYPWAEGVLKA